MQLKLHSTTSPKMDWPHTSRERVVTHSHFHSIAFRLAPKTHWITVVIPVVSIYLIAIDFWLSFRFEFVCRGRRRSLQLVTFCHSRIGTSFYTHVLRSNDMHVYMGSPHAAAEHLRRGQFSIAATNGHAHTWRGPFSWLRPHRAFSKSIYLPCVELFTFIHSFTFPMQASNSRAV